MWRASYYDLEAYMPGTHRAAAVCSASDHGLEAHTPVHSHISFYRSALAVNMAAHHRLGACMPVHVIHLTHAYYSVVYACFSNLVVKLSPHLTPYVVTSCFLKICSNASPSTFVLLHNVQSTNMLNSGKSNQMTNPNCVDLCLLMFLMSLALKLDCPNQYAVISYQKKFYHLQSQRFTLLVVQVEDMF